MFTTNHFVWISLSLLIVAVATVFLNKYKPPLKSVLTVCCVVAVLSELVKTFSMMQMVPSADGSRMYMYLEMQHLPLHLCSIQIISIFYCRFAADSSKKDALYAFMYPTCVLGALLALAMPSIFNGTIDVADAFNHPLAYQYFLYHSMLIALGLYIFTSGQVKIRPKHYFTTLGLLGLLAFCSLYFNSMFASAVYKNNGLKSVEYVPNLFFTYKAPISALKFTEIWHWYLYIAAITLLAVILIAVFYIPVFLKHKKKDG